MSKPRRDRLWPRQATTRHAWYRDGHDPNALPRQALVIAWRSHSYKWWARITYCVEITGQDEPAVIDRWVPAETLRPVPADPNRAFGLR
ncbi:hypothetical protein [Arthrobacter sp. RCC_34]|uniref:hypothetical protein n=1 Tax=Arthrobacter sp. RCC_34 TaxID=3239230 RepID=UPI00352421F7